MRPILIALFGSIIALPSAAIITCGIAAGALWLTEFFVTLSFLDTFLSIFWYAAAAAVIAVIPIFQKILKSERELSATGY